VVDDELHRELVFHFDQLVAEKIADGLSPAEARRAANRALGNIAALEEDCRDERRVSWIHDLRQDVVYGTRMLRKHPGLTTIAIASLALGIGANAAVLGAFDALVVQGLPVPQSDRLVAIESAPLDNPGQLGGLSLVDYAAIRDGSQLFETIDASIRWGGDIAADAPGTPPERIVGQLVTPGWLSMLGIRPALGRVFTEAETLAGAPRPIVISHGLWQRRFGGDPDILDRSIRIQGGPNVIVGVMPAEFRYQDPEVDYWAPLHVGARPDAGSRLFGVRARLKPGVSLVRAQADLDAIAAPLTSGLAPNKAWVLRARPLNESLFGWTREPLLTFAAAVALVWLIACANVAALLLSRAAVRQREVMLRVALGAGRGRIVRQLLTEGMLLAVAGGTLGLVVAVLGQRALTGMSTPPSSPPLTAIGLNPRVFGLLALLTIATGIVCGLVPAIRGSRLDPIGSLKEPNPAAPAPRRGRFPRGALVSVQLALALMLLVGSGLLLKSLVRLAWRDLNFDPAGLVRLDYGVPAASYAQRIGTQQGLPYFAIAPPPSQKLQQVLERLRAVPGAESVAGISSPPVDSFVLATMEVTLGPSASASPGGPDHESPQTAVYFLVTPHLFATLRTPIVRGRDFTDRDVATTPWVAVVNETCARRFWPGEEAIGQRLTMNTVPEEQPREVIGVVRDIPTRHAGPPEPVIYASYLQQPSRYRAPWAGLFGQMTFMLRRAGDADGLMALARQAVADVDPDRPLAGLSTVEARMRNATSKFRYFVLLVSVFAALATLLAAIGTYGVMAYSVSLRTREIGIRRALGAGRSEVVMLIGRRALALVGAALVCGVAGALLLTRLIASQLWGVTPTDPATFIGVSLLLVGVALAACIAPARRALAVDPTVALRAE
jgi:putative ABC transport system permease protein